MTIARPTGPSKIELTQAKMSVAYAGATDTSMNKPPGTYQDSITASELRVIANKYGGITEADFNRFLTEINSGTRTRANLEYWLNWRTQQPNFVATDTGTSDMELLGLFPWLNQIPGAMDLISSLTIQGAMPAEIVAQVRASEGYEQRFPGM